MIEQATIEEARELMRELCQALAKATDKIGLGQEFADNFKLIVRASEMDTKLKSKPADYPPGQGLRVIAHLVIPYLKDDIPVPVVRMLIEKLGQVRLDRL